MLAAATSFFARTAISQSYNFGPSSGSRSSTPGPNGSPSPAPVAHTPPIQIGLWKVQSATHKVTNKRVSVWSFDKRGQELERLNPVSKERTLEVLKAEASALGRLRHPSILEMVEPMEETRSELIFATEPILSSLQLSIPGASRYSATLVELDEVEIQKGVLQICKGLTFLHGSARLVHSNISPESIVINNSGDWKISGLGLTIPLSGPDGKPTRWEFPTYDGRVPAYIQRSFDYMAPEYALDEQNVTASDMYSLGCVLYAVHMKGSPPFKNHGSLGGLRDNAGRNPPDMERLDTDLQALLRSMITRHPANRPTPISIPSHGFFSSLPISTLNFLDRSTFTAKSREEKISFMKGLTNVLDKFSEGLRSRKILPSLLEEMKDTHLLPYILPNVFAISTVLSSTQFAAQVLPSLKPLFTVKDPPQNMLTLLDNLPMLQEKTEKNVFREQVLPLVYHALESEHAVVQERALKTVPGLCESIDYAEVQGVLFPRVALVFTKTRILSVKIATLVTFLAMVQTLDQSSLTQKLVPLLSKIRTKEPGVMMATLSVQEAMGFKVDREAVATLVLPQLWAMSIGPLINLEQFQRFMQVIKKLGDRVEKEHDQFLRDSQRVEDKSTTAVDGFSGTNSMGGGVDFESLVGRANGTAVKADSVINSNSSWDDDVWGSIFTSGTETSPISSPQMAATPAQAQYSLPQLSPRNAGSDSFSASGSRPSRLGAKPQSSSTLSASAFPSPPPPPQQRPSFTPMSQPLQPTSTGGMSPLAQPVQFQPQKPNYNISLSTAPLSAGTPSLPPSAPSGPNYNISLTASPPPTTSPPFFAGGSSMLAPSKPATPSWGNGSTKKATQSDWGDFDPLA